MECVRCVEALPSDPMPCSAMSQRFTSQQVHLPCPPPKEMRNLQPVSKTHNGTNEEVRREAVRRRGARLPCK